MGVDAGACLSARAGAGVVACAHVDVDAGVPASPGVQVLVHACAGACVDAGADAGAGESMAVDAHVILGGRVCAGVDVDVRVGMYAVVHLGAGHVGVWVQMQALMQVHGPVWVFILM